MKQGLIGSYFKRKADVAFDETHESVEGSSKNPCSNEIPQRPQDLQPSQISTTSDIFNDLCSVLMDRLMVTSHHPNQSDEIRMAITACKLLLKNALPFLGYDVFHNCLQGHFDELLSLILNYDDKAYNVTSEKAPQIDTSTSLKMQKHLVECISKEIIKSICDEIHNDVFAILVDEFSDVSKNKHMTIVLRYVDSLGIVKERFIGVVNMNNTSPLTLKEAIDSLIANNKLSIAQVRGQSYNGASNMRNAFKDLKSLILRDNDSAYYVHCLAHQLESVVVAIAINHDGARNFFEELHSMVNVFSASCEEKDLIRERYRERLQTEIGNKRVVNQETSLIRVRYGSYYKTIKSLMNLFSEVCEVLTYIDEEGSRAFDQREACGILSYFKTLEIVFYLHLMLKILGLTNTLSEHLQRNDQDISETASLVKATMEAVKTLRSNGFVSVLEEAFSFCHKHSIGIVEMSESYVTPRNRVTDVTNQHHFEVDIFNAILDMQILEFGDRFNESSIELLENMAAFSPCDSFSRFDKSQLLKLSELYKNDFDDSERVHLVGELENYYHTLLHDDRFAKLKEIADLSRVMVKTGKHHSFPLVYRLLKLTLVLPVTTATVESCFSEMKLLKTDLHDEMGYDFRKDAFVCNVEKEALLLVNVDNVIDRFQKMSNEDATLTCNM